MARHANHRLVKLHRSYTVEEISLVLKVHRHTVRSWLKEGMPATDARRPTLILGRELITFLKARRLRNKRSCKAGEIYCVRCRAPRRPAGGTVQYREVSPTLGDLAGTCPECACRIYRRVALAQIEKARGDLEISRTKGGGDIDETSLPSVNTDFDREAQSNANAQPR